MGNHTITPYPLHDNFQHRSKTCKEWFFQIVLFAAFALTSATEKGDHQIANLAKELAKERQETKEIFRRENEKLHARVDQLQAEDGRLREEVTKLRRELSDANSRIDKSARQKDQHDTTKFQNDTNSFRQDDLDEHMKQIIYKEVKNYLMSLYWFSVYWEVKIKTISPKWAWAQIMAPPFENKICVAGRANLQHPSKRVPVQFGKTFIREPTVVVSYYGYNGENPSNMNMGIYVENVTKSSAKIILRKGRCTRILLGFCDLDGVPLDIMQW